MYSLIQRAVLSIGMLAIVVGKADAQLLSTHYPEPSNNAALHYNRALLSLGMVPFEQREALSKPIWESFGDASRSEIKTAIGKLAYEGRHAIRAALKGTSCEHADFGIDYSDYGHGVDLPHCQPMLELGRLLCLAGIHAQIEEDWTKSATLLFESLRMGRHMAHQPTLAESIVGVQILENTYFALAFWGSKCPEPLLVKQAFLRFEAATDGILRPAFTLANEASIIERQMERVRSAYPEGPWAEMLLDSLGAFTIAQDKETLEAKAIQLCQERGVPASIFESKASFDDYVSKLSRVRANYFRSLAACMTLPPNRRHGAATSVYDRAKAQISNFSKSELMAPDYLVSVFATHSAERAMTRIALAVAASKTNAGFPASLDAVAPVFSGDLPTSPYDGNPMLYQLLNDGKDFSVTVPASVSGEVQLPEIQFSSELKARP